MLSAGREIDHQRRRAGIERRVDPAVDPERGSGGLRLAPIERSRKARAELGAGDEGAGHHGEKARRANGIPVPFRHVGPGRSNPQSADGGFGAPAMHLPQGPRARIAGAQRQIVVEGAGRAMPEAGLPVDPVERLGTLGATQPNDRPKDRTNAAVKSARPSERATGAASSQRPSHGRRETKGRWRSGSTGAAMPAPTTGSSAPDRRGFRDAAADVRAGPSAAHRQTS